MYCETAPPPIGVDKLMGDSLPFLLTHHAGSSYAQLMSEYVVSQMVNWERQHYGFYSDQLRSRWSQERRVAVDNPRMLSSLTIGILGVGTIGKRGEFWSCNSIISLWHWGCCSEVLFCGGALSPALPPPPTPNSSQLPVKFCYWCKHILRYRVYMVWICPCYSEALSIRTSPKWGHLLN